jgi:4-hydroxy-tetrahydrodipicolinate synthase
MANISSLRGVYAAALTPLGADGELALDDLVLYLDFLAKRGCHGALLLGTTGEGPSFSPAERLAILRSSLMVREKHTNFRLLAGTGTPSLDETIQLTRQAFDLGLDGVVTLPPYYYRKISTEGLYHWFSQVIEKAVPQGGAFFGYHIPPVTGVSLPLDLLAKLIDAYPDRFAGIKDSSADAEHARQVGERFGNDLLIFTGNDALLSLALQNRAGGCITALANLRSSDLRKVWDEYQKRKIDLETQSRLDAARTIVDRFPPAPPLLKFLASELYGLPKWSVRLPLLPLAEENQAMVLEAVDNVAPAFMDRSLEG